MSLKSKIGTGMKVVSIVGLAGSLSTCIDAKQNLEDIAAQIKVLEEFGTSIKTERDAINKKLDELKIYSIDYHNWQLYATTGILGSICLLGLGNYLSQRGREE
ncbi:MAG: hypothetical protein AABX64_00190 [Nanoarchaeota archaeon]